MASKFEILLQARLDKTNSDAQIRQDIKSLEKKLSLNLDLKADSKSATQIKNAISEVGNAAKKAQEHTQGLGDIIGKFSSWQIVGDVIHGVKDAIADMVDQVFELDASLTELDKVTDLTSEGLQQLTDDAFTVGQQIGATGKDVIDATTIFAQAGYEAQEALDLSEQAIMLKNVSEAGATAEKSASTLIATMKAFGLEAEDSGHIVDALNEVSNKYAVSVNDLSTAIQKSAASMATGNNTLEETFGLVTAGVEILQEPGRVANGLSTITARLTAENDAYIKSITGGQGVIDEQTGQLRSTMEILGDLSEKWETLSSVEQQELAEVVAGKTQRSLFTAIMTNFESAVGATETALNSEGSAAAENAKRMESLEGRVIALQSAWQKLATTTINSDFIKSLLSAVTGFINLVDAVGGLVPVLTTVLGLVAMFKAQEIGKQAQKIGNSIISLINGFKILKQQIFGAAGANVIYLGSAESTQVANTGLAASFSALSLAIGAVTAIISIGVMLWNAYQQSIDDARDAAVEASQASKEVITEKEEEISKIEDEIDTLEQEKDKYIENSKAKNDDEAHSNFIKNKDEEIKKRKQNIDTIEQEIAKENEQRLGSLNGAKKNDADWSGIGWGNSWSDWGMNVLEKADYAQEINNVNAALATAQSSTGEYARKIEELQGEYQRLKTEQEEAGESTEVVDAILADLNVELERNSEKLEEDRKLAEEYYDILRDGTDIGQDNLDWLKSYYDLTDEQIEQIKNGTDVLATQEEQVDAYTEAINEAAEAESNYDAVIDSNIQKLVDYGDQLSILTSAQDMLTESGHLTAEMYKQLADNNLIQYLDIVNGKLQVNKDAFDLSSQAAIDNAEQAVKDKLAQQLLQIALADQNGTLQETADKLGLVSTKSNGVNTTNAVNQILKIGAAADTSKWKLGDLFATMENGEMVNSDYTPSSQAQDLMNQAISNAQKEIAAINSISLDSFKSSGGSGSSGSGSKSSRGSSSSKSSADTYKAEINTLYKYENALDNAKDAVDRLNDALDNTDNFEEQEKILKQLIDATNDEIDATEDLKDAQVDQINDYIRQLKKYGFQINYNSKTNELYIKNMDRLGKYTGDTAKKLEEMIEEIQDLNDDNRDLDSSIRDLTGDIQDFNEQLDELPTEKLEKFHDLLEEFQQSRLDQIQNEIDDIQHDMDNDPRLQALEEQIEALEKQNDELDNQKDLEEKLLAVEEAKIKLQNAQNEKNIQVYREGQGWVK